MKKIKIRLLIPILILVVVLSILVILTKNDVLATEGECAVCGGTGKISGRCEGGYTSTCSTCEGSGYTTHTGSYTYDSSTSLTCNSCKKPRNSKTLYMYCTRMYFYKSYIYL